MRRIWLAIGILTFVFSLAVTPALAQEATKPKAPEKTAEKKPAPPKPPPAELKGEKADTSDLKPVTGEKVVVQLREGDVLRGIVKAARIEVLKDGRYVPSKDNEEQGAGIRVWYAMGLNGFVFVPYVSVDAIEFQGPLPEAEGLEIARWIAAEKRKKEERLKQAMRAREAKRKAAEKDEAGEEEDEEAGKPKPDSGSRKDVPTSRPVRNEERAARIGELLKRFPPDKWKPSRLAEIKDRQLILSINPTDEERAFMKSYDLWLEGYELWQKTKGK
jgi:hypothetical protein